jgi:hypothetical protein
MRRCHLQERDLDSSSIASMRLAPLAASAAQVSEHRSLEANPFDANGGIPKFGFVAGVL